MLQLGSSAAAHYVGTWLHRYSRLLCGPPACPWCSRDNRMQLRHWTGSSAFDKNHGALEVGCLWCLVKLTGLGVVAAANTLACNG